MIIKKLLNNAKKVDIFIDKFLRRQSKSLLIKPMKYGVLSGGKKIRSSIIYDVGKLYNLKSSQLTNVCAAVESIHSYSLIHDDLPCMDNDSIRRGKPSTHIKFGESTAVLAGNSLLTLAFEILTDTKFNISHKSKLELIQKLAKYSGHEGIAGGQELDLKFEKKKKSISQIINMQKKKTGKLFEFSCLAPAIIANRSLKEKRYIANLGIEIGLLFQIADDFLDIKGSTKDTGKPIKNDKKKGKSTLIKILGYQKAQNYAKNLKKKILRNLKKHGKKAKDLNATIEFVLSRKF